MHWLFWWLLFEDNEDCYDDDFEMSYSPLEKIVIVATLALAVVTLVAIFAIIMIAGG